MRRWAFISVLLLALPGAAWACPSCRDSIESPVVHESLGDGRADMAGGFNAAIYAMLVGVGGAVGIVGVCLGKVIGGVPPRAGKPRS